MRGTVVKRINRELRKMNPPETSYELERNRHGRPACIRATGHKAWRKALKRAWGKLPRTIKRHAEKGKLPMTAVRTVQGSGGFK